MKNDGEREKWTRRGWFGALAGAAALVAAVAGRRRTRRETVAEKREKRRLWIGHT
jgi:hypothetical protein